MSGIGANTNQIVLLRLKELTSKATLSSHCDVFNNHKSKDTCILAHM